MTGPSIARRDVVALVLAAACWGLGTVVSKRALEEIHPLTLLLVQLLASLVVLGLVLRRTGVRLREPGASPILGRLGLLNPGLAYALSLIGLVTISASLSVLLWAVEPMMIMVLAAWFLRERISATFVVLSVVALVGMVLVVYDPSSSGQWIGIAFTIAGVACCATYTVVARRWLPTEGSTIQVVALQQVYALGFALAAAIVASLALGAPHVERVAADAWLSAVASGVLYFAAAYWFYLSALRKVPASMAAMSFYMIPVFGVAGGVLLLGERFDPRQWLGVAIVLGALWLIVRQPGSDAAEAVSQQAEAA